MLAEKNPLVSIVCLCYNQDQFVEETLNSIIEQDYSNIELIIIDDCSSDKSVEKINNWISQHSFARFIKNEINLGSTKSFNKAFKLSKGEYIIDLAADDVLMKDCITKQVEAFNSSKLENLGIVYGNAEQITEEGSFDSYYFPTNEYKKVIEKRKTGDIYISILEGGSPYCSVSAMIKREAYENLNGYDENIYYEDLDFWIRASRIYNIDFIDEPVIKKRIVKNSQSSQFNKPKKISYKINQSTYLILKKAFSLNTQKQEFAALLKRVHYEILLCLKTKNYILFFKNTLLKLRIEFKLITLK